ncbi:MAG: hypothetical protein PHW24_04650, partial [Candidatus Moranbacteria bacterium]|nr:hypothetical protein [Candidatus Moranbacteria bacterium]
QFSYQGVTKLLIDTNGNVGIGTTSPTAQLTLVKADSSALTDFLINPTAKTSGNLIDAQVGGVSKFSVSSAGGIVGTGLNIGSGAIAFSGTLWSNASAAAANNTFQLSSNTGAKTNGSGQANYLSLTPAYNQTSGTASNTDLLINRTETAIGSGIQLLIDAQVGGVSKFNVTNTGQGYFAGNVGIGTTSPTAMLDIKGTAVNDLPTYGTEFLSGSGWTSTGWTGDFATGWTHTTGNTSVLSQSTAAVVGTQYQVVFTVTGSTAGSFTVSFGGQSSMPTLSSGGFGPTATSTAGLTITPTADFNGKIVVSIKPITAASTPIFVLRSSDGTAQLEMRSSGVTTAAPNTFIGVQAGQYNTSGYANVATGYSALKNNTSGKVNTAIGVMALMSNTTGAQNVANGYGALAFNTSGNNNTANGVLALAYNTTGYQNTAIGESSMESNTTGYYNTANGANALLSNTTGYYNVANGPSSLQNITTGFGNTGDGTYAGRYIANGSTSNATSNNSVYLGFDTRAFADGDTNEIVIGANATGLGSNTVILGDSNIVTTALRGSVGIGTTSPSSMLSVGATSQFQVNSTGAVVASTGYTQTSGNFAMSGTGTFGTGTGAISLNGATSVTGTNTFSVGTGLTTLGGNLTVTGTAWTATPTISGLITASNGLTVAANKNLIMTAGTGKATLPKIAIERNANAGSGVSWYNAATYTAWATYMGSAGVANQGPTANITAPTGTLVTSWGLRNFIENTAGYGWTWESGTSATATPAIVAELSSATGNFRTTGTISGTRLISTIATGTSPLAVTSTTVNTNLNADLLDGQHASAFQTALSGGTNGYNAYWTGAGTLGSEQYVDVSRGGTGTGALTQGSMVFAGASGVYAQDNANLFWDDTNNRLGIGTTTPGAMLSIFGTTNALRLSYDASNYVSLSSASNGDLQFSSSSSSESAVIVGNNTATNASIIFDNLSQDYYSGIDNADGVFKIGAGQTVGTSSILAVKASNGFVGVGTTAPTAMLQIGSTTNPGNVRIDQGWLCVDNNGTCTGAATAGTVYAVAAYTTGADYAEYFYTKDSDLKSGEAVCVDTQTENGVKRCQNDGDNNIMGIVSSNPSIVGNKNHADDPNYKIIGMMGQVAGKVSAENGAIKVGDNLTAGATPGSMRKANAGESTVGVAMENLSDDNGTIQVLISRRNQSLTVEKVEQAVTDNIASMNIKDQVSALVNTASTNLNEQIANQTNVLATMQTQISDSVNTASKLQMQIDLIRQENQALIDLVGVLNVKSLIYKDSLGNLDLLDGKLAASEIETGVLTIKVVDSNKPTIGQATIRKMMVDANNDGVDDLTGTDGKTVEIKTGAVTADSKVFTSFVKNPGSFNWVEKVVDKTTGEFTGFKIFVETPVKEDVSADWWIVESKNK